MKSGDILLIKNDNLLFLLFIELILSLFEIFSKSFFNVLTL